jgi:Cu(I)/Ag(I) efflux system membrane fusion protein
MINRWLVALVGTILSAGLVLAAINNVGRAPVDESSAAPDAKVVYQCAMHPQVIRTEPGSCPICGMTLMRVDPADQAADASDTTSHVNGEAGATAARAGIVNHASHEAGAGPADPTDAVHGRAPFSLTPERQQLIGVKRGTVERRPLELELHAPGRIAYDPALYQALVEYREAMRAQGAVRGTALEGRAGSDAILRGARLKLRQQGLSEALIRDLAASGSDPIELLLPGTSAWVYAQVFEHEASIVSPGQTVRIASQSYPGRTFKGRVVGVDPILDATTRTVRVRALVSTDGATLRPESLVEVHIEAPLGEMIAVPRDAVLDSGDRRIVFVVRGAGSFTPREVQLGRRAGEWIEVLAGLDAGDEVVTSANFLIDSESKIRSALAAFQGQVGESGGSAGAAAPSAHHH